MSIVKTSISVNSHDEFEPSPNSRSDHIIIGWYHHQPRTKGLLVVSTRNLSTADQCPRGWIHLWFSKRRTLLTSLAAITAEAKGDFPSASSLQMSLASLALLATSSTLQKGHFLFVASLSLSFSHLRLHCSNYSRLLLHADNLPSFHLPNLHTQKIAVQTRPIVIAGAVVQVQELLFGVKTTLLSVLSVQLSTQLESRQVSLGSIVKRSTPR